MITDRIDGEFDSAVARFHLHPDVILDEVREASLILGVHGGIVSIFSSTSYLLVEPSLYSPEFGRQIESKCITINFNGQSEIETTITWSNKCLNP